jgi:hypothetical protein
LRTTSSVLEDRTVEVVLEELLEPGVVQDRAADGGPERKGLADLADGNLCVLDRLSLAVEDLYAHVLPADLLDPGVGLGAPVGSSTRAAQDAAVHRQTYTGQN